MHRFPSDTHADATHFRSSGWREALATALDYSGMWQSLSTAAEAAVMKDETRRERCFGYWLMDAQ